MIEPIKRIDLNRLFESHREEYLDAIAKACDAGSFSGGIYADKFDEEFATYCGVAAATGVNNGTSALHCAMMALGIGIGDEVIVPANTFIATAWGPTYAGATPVFVDCTSDTWELDANKIEDAVTKKTKAIIGVHLYGQPFDVDEVTKIAKCYGLHVVEDCAQAHGALYKGRKTGGLVDIGCFSFYPGKNLCCFGEGGSVTSDYWPYIEHIIRLKNHGSDIRYHHDEIGYNMRLEGIQGAVLSVSLKYLDAWTAKRRTIGKRYDREIINPYITLQRHPDNTETVYHLYVVTVPDRDAFLRHMDSKGIMCDMHYPIPCHLQKAYSFLNYKRGDCPNAEYLAEHCCSLPMFPELREDEIERVIEACNSFRM
ncbi:DegT/DnrJ/EryC1/StrS family aminotransferase [Lachnotalea sp. AF33-28]|jgi:dTDP-4-amino-4,6-dideoxygalactose transaminase|uniref:DegT/DnrJ/EryC1/StrS family aminotransferase n=1 Tax=Lachnotalea sp. AF33-28 TaxID=2292046 RepID=UPI000E475E4A|nr:DegT/DnrJ/EryC1/StrS family aminotransferase [Lachnotalea sp. AF33-28]RHP34952.1 DegT/DnrJ/EryC1/StrS family aminotransferase [Lachnotalea sp. AF33-28]